ncbi:MAG: 2Fe-2S iron-sulfur cluster binding domain-containing protein [Gammaproteobacteria bacterium]|nr:2Fe-2S iron-sulfur cluster binding domain-containing protein [Gammaproteobacteria bacterium]
MSFSITLAPFGLQFECAAEETILAAALRQGIGLRYGCKHGACGSCKARIVEGEVDLAQASGFALMGYERDAGLALLCSAYPLDDIVVQLEDYTETELHAARPTVARTGRVVACTPCSPDIWQLLLALEGGEGLDFDAGQFVEVNVPGTDEWRAYSMANAPSDRHLIELLIKKIPGGCFSGLLPHALPEGTRVAVRGPYGQFNVQVGSAPIVMVAGGSGMAPILSMLRALAAQACAREIVFYYGARTAADLICGPELAALAAQLPAFRYIPTISEPMVAAPWAGETGLVTAALARDGGNLRGAEAYLCGPPGMVDAAAAVLKIQGMFSSRIRCDKFVSTQGP